MPSYIDLVLLSDTRGLHRRITVPAGDVLIHAGDFTGSSHAGESIRDFNPWLVGLPYRFKIVVPENHEFWLEADPRQRSFLSNATVLIKEGIVIEGLRFWGSPTTPLYGGAFGLSSAADRSRHWTSIPPMIDVLVTHGPPLRILDRASQQREHLGDPELLDAVKLIHPRIHVFGHVHGAYGQAEEGGSLFVNCALAGTGSAIDHPPMVISVTI